MANLVWTDATGRTQLVEKEPLAIGFRACMEGSPYTAPPEYFYLWRMFSPVIASASRERGNQGGKHLDGDKDHPEPVEGKPGKVRSRPFALGVRFTGTHRWRFTDGSDWSPTIRTVRFAAVRPRAGLRTPAVLPVDAELGVEIEIPAGLKDPTVELSVLRTWPTSEGAVTVEDILQEEIAGEDGEFDEELYHATLKLLDPYLAKENPQGWEVWIDPDRLEVAPGQAATARLRIHAGEPAGVALAISAVDVDDPEAQAHSDVFVVKYDEDRKGSLLYADEAD